MRKIRLGDKVQCKHTGFTGICVAKTFFINGCVQFNVAPQVDKEGKFQEEICIDEGSLEIVKKIKGKPKPAGPGGASKKAVKMKGY